MLSDLFIIIALVCAAIALYCAAAVTTFGIGVDGRIAAALVAYFVPAAYAAAKTLAHSGPSSPRPPA